MNTPPGPYDELKRSLKRAGLMILIMVVIAALLMGYITYEFHVDGPSIMDTQKER